MCLLIFVNVKCGMRDGLIFVFFGLWVGGGGRYFWSIGSLGLGLFCVLKCWNGCGYGLGWCFMVFVVNIECLYWFEVLVWLEIRRFEIFGLWLKWIKLVECLCGSWVFKVLGFRWEVVLVFCFYGNFCELMKDFRL